jgi:hypothetical protein
LYHIFNCVVIPEAQVLDVPSAIAFMNSARDLPW